MRRLLSVAALAVAATDAGALDEGALFQSKAVARERADYGLNGGSVYGLNGGSDYGLNGGAIMEVAGEFADVTQYGQPVMLTVHPVFGDDLPILFRPGMRLQTLMHSVCHKLDLNLNITSFTKDGKPLDPQSKGTAFDLSNGDVLEVSTPDLLRQAAEAQAAVLRTEKQSRMRLLDDEFRDQKEAIRNLKRRKKAEKVAKKVEFEQRKHKLEEHGEITLHFTNPTGGDDVSMAVKRVNWLDGYLKLVAKRFGVDRAQTLFLFKDEDGNMNDIQEHESVQTLGLRDDDQIMVKVRNV